MTEADFSYLRRFLKARSGLDLAPVKRYLAETRLLPVCRARGYGSLGELMRHLRDTCDEELGRLVVDAMSTQETSFFRDRAPFEALRDTILPRLAAARRGVRPLRIWSAACATGQEPYSLAMLVADMAPMLAGCPVTILATDLSPTAVARARAGAYSQFEIQRGLPVGHVLRHFEHTEAGWVVSPALRAAVEFRELNLLRDFRQLGRFDVILCRNLMIYLDPATKADLLTRLAGALAPDGVLCLGAAESVLGSADALRPDPQARGFLLRAPTVALPAQRLAAV